MRFIRELFCKHYYEIIKDRFNDSGKRMLNHYGYYTKKSKCILCGKIKEHD